ncbi:MAG: CBS domain-containing protein [Desulfarculus sp.]|nr:CBS domain-containing protein [Desulfarculus sp.]
MSKVKTEKKVRDLTVPLADYPHMPYWATLKEAVVQLTLAQQGRGPEERRRKVLVFDEAYKLQGVLTQRDILRGIEPQFARDLVEGATPLWDDLFSASAQQQAKKAIKDFMSPVGTVVQADDGLLKASHVMVMEGVDLVPVMEDNRVLGVVRLDDVFHEISKTILSN